MSEKLESEDTSVAGLIDRLTREDPTVDEVARRVCELAVLLISRADGASLTIYGAEFRPYTKVATDTWVSEADELQYQTLQGPCIEVAATSAPTSGSADLQLSESWPVFGPQAAQAGIGSLLAAGISAHPVPGSTRNPPGALNIYSHDAFAFGPEEREQAVLLAAVAGLTVSLAASRMENRRLREAITSRDVIGQAKGILMERHGLDDREAFSILRRTSNQVNLKLRDVAARIAAGKSGTHWVGPHASNDRPDGTGRASGAGEPTGR